MRIALVCPYAWDDPGGVQVHVRALGERLLARGHRVVGFAPARARPSEGWVRAIGRPVGLTYNASSAPIDPRPWSALEVRRSLERFGPEVVHVHEPFAPSTALWAVLTSRAPIVATFHSGATRSRLFDAAAPLVRPLARRLKASIAVSEAAERFAATRLGGVFERIPNGVDVGAWARAEPRPDLLGAPAILFCGRLDRRKGFRFAVRAFARLARERPDLRLVVAGDGPERAALSGLEPQVRGRVRMLGAVPNAELPPVHAACAAYAGAAIGGESFGVVLVEAMAAGLPVVASDIPGYREVVRDGVDGLLVPPADAGALAAGLGRVLDDPELAARLRQAGRERARSFDWEVVVDRLEAVYRRVATGGSPLR
jgi:phosphatidylinositol alpha-mannosyltransferase